MPQKKSDKVFLHLYIDKKVLEKAKQIIPNLSAFVEMKLREYIVLFEAGLEKDFEWTRRDLNPGPPPCEGGALPLSYEPSKIEIFRVY